MVDFTAIVVIAAIIVAIFIIFKVVKTVAKAMFIVSLLILLIAGIVAFFSYRDIAELREGLENEPKTILLADGDEIIAGFIDKGSGEMPEFLNSKRVEYFNSLYEEKNFREIVGDNYRAFIVKADAIRPVGSIDFFGNDVPGDVLFSSIRQDNSISYFERNTGASFGLTDDNKEFNSYVFSTLFEDKLKINTGLFILTEYSRGNIAIYPETIVFKIIRLVPVSLLESRVERVKDDMIEKAREGGV